MLKGIWDVAMSPVLWLLYLLIALGVVNVGCMAVNPAGQLREILSDPAVQSSLDKWSANAQISNPAFEAYLIQGVGIRVIGANVAADVSGDARSAGLDAERLAKLHAASQPVPH